MAGGAPACYTQKVLGFNARRPMILFPRLSLRYLMPLVLFAVLTGLTLAGVSLGLG